ncbi:unnamed protein product [Caenorhabditis auriculariae]|uniref:Uncharacterized protein n=1 Tax=Caenorhabditis auriculariae TaxID=2777116 RepID=A0A8S1GYG4_9PELO|nr:unnamed protein product [Caenorhabditis auriculariae]
MKSSCSFSRIDISTVGGVGGGKRVSLHSAEWTLATAGPTAFPSNFYCEAHKQSPLFRASTRGSSGCPAHIKLKTFATHKHARTDRPNTSVKRELLRRCREAPDLTERTCWQAAEAHISERKQARHPQVITHKQLKILRLPILRTHSLTLTHHVGYAHTTRSRFPDLLLDLQPVHCGSSSK